MHDSLFGKIGSHSLKPFLRDLPSSSVAEAVGSRVEISSPGQQREGERVYIYMYLELGSLNRAISLGVERTLFLAHAH